MIFVDYSMSKNLLILSFCQILQTSCNVNTGSSTCIVSNEVVHTDKSPLQLNIVEYVQEAI